MTTEKILTSEEFLNQKPFLNGMTRMDQRIAMIEFAKLHVQEVLKQALESIPCLGSSTDIASYEEVEEAVLNSYPLENII